MQAAQPASAGKGSFADLLASFASSPANADRDLRMRAYERWIKENGDSADLAAAWFNLGVESAQAGDEVRASHAYRRALAARPQFHPAALNLGLMLERAASPEAALSIWSQALQPDDARTALLNQRARLLEQLGRLGEAEEALCASLATNPAQPDAIHHWVHLRQRMCRWPVLPDGMPGLLQADLLADCGPLAALSITDRVAAQTAITARWLARKTSPAPGRLSPTCGYQHDMLRIGYLSSDFGRHAMGYLIPELFERHDRTRFVIYGYCLGCDDGSALRARIIRSFDRFRLLEHLDDEEAARAIAADEVDILIDLNGLTRGSRPQILRWRPAPVQAIYLGFVGPMPLPELDYLLCDDYVVPSASAPSYRPAPLVIGPIFQANDTKRDIGPPQSRVDLGLPENSFIFCCFSNHYKVTQGHFLAWMEILRRVPGSILWLAADNAWSHATMQAQAVRLGVAPTRIMFAERVDPAIYIRRLALADLFLDTFPYNAGTVASDAIRMSLPLLTLTGEAFASRMAARLLKAIGAELGITTTLESYVEIAASLGNDREKYASYKTLFNSRAWHSTIGNTTSFMKEYQTALFAAIAATLSAKGRA